MTTASRASDHVIETLRERAKELHCLYRVHELLSRADEPLPEICRGLVDVIPPGWQYPADCCAKITLAGEVYQSPRCSETEWVQHADVSVRGEIVGAIDVYYTREHPAAAEGPFLKEERTLLDTIAQRIAEFALQRGVAGGPRGATRPSGADEWPVVVEFLRRTDSQLLARISRRMMNHLCWMGVERAQALLASYASSRDAGLGDNQPLEPGSAEGPADPEDVFGLAAENLSGHEIMMALERWIRDDKGGFLLETADHLSTTLTEISQALDRFQQIGIDEQELSRPTRAALRVALTRRVLTDDPSFIRVAKDHLSADDYGAIMHRVIGMPTSHGKLGGKSAGMLLASAIVRKATEYADVLADVRVPRTWFIASDVLLDFVEYNHLQDIYNRKYFEIEQLRRDYPNVVQVFRHSVFPPEIVNGLALALDDLPDRPIIVRSSSLLEDRQGAAFSGKYKSLFVANRGSKAQRLRALMDAVAEVYASLFGPDPIQYRAERGLIDFHEEMAVMIQEVVGTQVGRYFLPTHAGVAFSTNELRWSPRIRREDGLVRIVPGLGTRAVDRLADDYPVLIAPGQPGLRVNVTPADVMRYSPRRVDLINLESGRFETMEFADLLRECGRELPALSQTLSIVDPEGGRRPVDFTFEPGREQAAVTFDGLIERTAFIPQIRALLRLLHDTLGVSVDVEFASDGKHLYLLQCRTQSAGGADAPSPIPRDVPPEAIVFSANRYVSNGAVPDLTHIVYVDPNRYEAMTGVDSLRQVGRAVGRLNTLLPKGQIALMGPGRWGSRGDITLGVSVTYSDINNAALLIEIAKARAGYVPDVSFGTHFFQDLVESGIRYLPLYPDDAGTVFNEAFLLGARNLLPELLPEHADLSDVVHVIDVPQSSGGRVLRVLMNADSDEAIGILAPPRPRVGAAAPAAAPVRQIDTTADHWRWRLRMAERIADEVDAARFGVRRMYVCGSTKNATAGPASDIDLIVHFSGSDAMRQTLEAWLDGWSRALSEMNFLRTGCRTDGLLDVHIVTDEDIERRSSWAVKIGAVTDAARPLMPERDRAPRPADEGDRN